MLQYDLEQKKFSELKEIIEIPKFQRGLVWNKDKKREFIKTLKNGMPIGILLLSPKNEKYLIIDGLQRFTTMIDYDHNYFKYIDKDQISDLSLVEIILSSESGRQIYDNFPDNVQSQIREQMRSIIIEGFQERKNSNLNDVATKVTMELCRNISFFKKDEAFGIQSKVYVALSKVEESAKISDVKIPLIIFRGKEDKLADIFQKLNQEGVKLTKYDVFAATWINDTVIINGDDEFIKLITAKYDSAQEESGLEISNYDSEEMARSGELTVFEYAFAVGKSIMNKCEHLFKRVDKSKVDSIGFIILAEILGLTYQEMGKLSERIKEYNQVDYKKFKDAILESARIVENALGSYIISPTSKKVSLACHSELQLASYIIVVFKLKYEITKENGLQTNSRYRNEIKDVKLYLHKHYLFDILRDFWAGAGDSKLEDIIREPSICRYTRDVEKEQFEQAILNWLDESIQKTLQSAVSAQSKLFWNYFLRKSGVNLTNRKFDIEHCAPQKALKKHYIEQGIEIPVSSACNLCYIDMPDNRGKGEKTYYQKQAKYPGAYLLNEEELDKLLYPSKSELSFLDSTSSMSKENYINYLRGRKKTISKRMISVLYPNN